MFMLLRLLFIVLCFMWPGTKGFCQYEIEKESVIDVAPDFFFMSHKASDASDKSSSIFEGIYLAGTFRPYQPDLWLNVFHTELRADYGKTDYKFPDKVNDVDNFMLEPRVWIGKDINVGDHLRITPYTGFGYRWYYEHLKNRSFNGGIGGNVQTQYFYLPIGADVSIVPAFGWQVVINGEFDYMYWGRVTNYSPGVVVYGDNINNKIQNGFGGRGSIKLVKQAERFNYFVEPYVRYWSIPKSNTVNFTFMSTPTGDTFQTAANKSVETGVRVGIEF